MRGNSFRPARLDNAPLDYEPQNELGVVYLFSHLARRRFGLRVEGVQAGYPDCIAYRGGELIRIEFEYRSHNFLQHGHKPKDCDWIVCWIHDWPAAPKHLTIVELRKEFGLGFNVWLQPVKGKYREGISQLPRSGETWSVSGQASKGDLVLYYRTTPDRFIKDICRIATPVEYKWAKWKRRKDWRALVRPLCSLKTPMHLVELQSDPILKYAGFVQGRMQNRCRLSAHWPELYRMILERNPSLKSTLKPYGPERLA